MLQTVNRYEGLVDHFRFLPSSYIRKTSTGCACRSRATLATLTTNTRRLVKLPAYRHEDLRVSYDPLIAALRASLTVSYSSRTPCRFRSRRSASTSTSVWSTTNRCSSSAAFVLAARADLPAESIRKNFPAQTTIAPVESIAKLVNDHLPGVPLQALSVVPRQIPFHAGFVYFELERNSPRFRELKSGGGIALHIPDTFPGLAMELWALRG